MAFKHYNHLNVPDSWERYFTKYPQGMSILESLFEWVSQVDSMVDNQNKLNTNVEQFRKEIDVFVGRFDDRLQTEVINTLKDWQDSGFLDVVISEGLQWQLDNYIVTNEQDKLSLTSQLAQRVKHGENESITKTMLSQEIKEEINNGEITFKLNTSEIENGAVTPNRTDFARDSGGKNLFLGTFYKGRLNGNSPYELRGEGGSNVGNTHYAVIQVKPKNTYQIIKSTDTTYLTVGGFETYPEVGDEPVEMYNTFTSLSKGVVITGEKVNYLVVVPMASTDGSTPRRLQVLEGNIETPYDETYINLSLDSHHKLMRKSERNLFSGNYEAGRLNGNPPYALISPANHPAAGNAKYTIISVVTGEVYTISKSSDTTSLSYGTFTNEPKVGDTPIEYKIFPSDIQKTTLTIGEGINYLVVVPMASTDEKPPTKLQVEKGYHVTAYEDPYVIKSELLEKSNEYVPEDTSSEKNLTIVDYYYADYEPITQPPTSFGAALNLDAVYGHYDNLMNLFPDYIRKSLIGNEVTGLPIYRYDFEPPTVRNHEEVLPKIIAFSGVHGQEKQAIATNMRFFEDLCKHWQTSDLLKMLRWNIHFVVIPAVNAYGVKNNLRYNSNNVNINRNFPELWEYNENQFDSSGSKPLSEIESQLMYNLLKTEKNVIFALENHTFNSITPDGYTIWTGTLDKRGHKNLAGWARDMQGDFLKYQPEYADANISRVGVHDREMEINHGWLLFACSTFGIPNAMLEISPDNHINDFHTHALAKLYAYAVKHTHQNVNNWID